MLSETGFKNIDELKVTCRAVLRDIDWAVQGEDWTRIIRMARALKWVSDCALFSVADAERKNGRALTTKDDQTLQGLWTVRSAAYPKPNDAVSLTELSETQSS
jgi:hypothetical protein